MSSRPIEDTTWLPAEPTQTDEYLASIAVSLKRLADDHTKEARVTEEQLIDLVAARIERSMFAPHDLPLSDQLHASYRITARAVIDELKFAKPKWVKTDLPATEAMDLAAAMRELWPNGWQKIDDPTVAQALDRFAADARAHRMTQAIIEAGIAALGEDDDRSAAEKVLDIWQAMNEAA